VRVQNRKQPAKAAEARQSSGVARAVAPGLKAGAVADAAATAAATRASRPGGVAGAGAGVTAAPPVVPREPMLALRWAPAGAASSASFLRAMEAEGRDVEAAAPAGRVFRLPVSRAHTMLRLALLARAQLAAAAASDASHVMAAALHSEQARALDALSACYIAVFSAALVPAAADAGVLGAGAAVTAGGSSGTQSPSKVAAAAEAAALGSCPVCASQLRWSGGNASQPSTGGAAAGGGRGPTGSPLPLLQPAPLFQPWAWMTEQIALQPPPEAVMVGALQAMESPWGGLQLKCTGRAAAPAAAAAGSSSDPPGQHHAFRTHPLTLEPLAGAASGGADPAVMGLRSAVAELAIAGPVGAAGRGGSAEAAGSLGLPPRVTAASGQRPQLHAAQLLPSPTGFSY
jgi:hypothetical protein